ncbi:MAG: carbohydrate kinase family protein [Clostridiales bacterium]|nr:carbohydrate kinase family protein [Clostridiales bacterium]
MRITVVGGMNLDLLGTPENVLLPRDSVPGHIAVRPGGVGRNIAARLKELGAQVSLITAVGCDVRAAMLAQMCHEAGIDLSHAVQTPCPAPCYLCIHDQNGDMIYAVNDMAAMNELTPRKAETFMDWINQSDGCVLDANVPEETLSYIARHASVPLILDPVSTVKAVRALPILPDLTAIKPNLIEAKTLTGETDAVQAGEKLLSMGVKNVCISLGAEGVYYASVHDKGLIPARKLTFLPQTGAGDAFCAGLTKGLLSGLSLRESAQLGCDTAFFALSRAKNDQMAL